MTKLWLIVHPNTHVVVEANVHREGAPPTMATGDALPLGWSAFLVDTEKAVIMRTELVERK